MIVHTCEDRDRQRLEQARRDQQAELENIFVKSNIPATRDGQGDLVYQCAVWDKHPAHENGELYIADDQVHTVAATPNVLGALREGRLLLIDDKGHAQWRGDGPPRIPFAIKPDAYRLVRLNGEFRRDDELTRDEMAEVERQEQHSREEQERYDQRAQR